jgi:riboflavin synthase
MFTGIVEHQVQLQQITKEQSNVHFRFFTEWTQEFRIDQSISHNGCCLTVVAIDLASSTYTVTAIQETLEKTTLGTWKIGDFINIERSMRPNDRLDGHMVQGHVDTRGVCTQVEDLNGSWKFHFSYEADALTVEKGSIAVNGVSLTVVDSAPGSFSVCIIPYTFDNTHFKTLQAGDLVNLEFDVVGKYVAKYLRHYGN